MWVELHGTAGEEENGNTDKEPGCELERELVSSDTFSFFREIEMGNVVKETALEVGSSENEKRLDR